MKRRWFRWGACLALTGAAIWGWSLSQRDAAKEAPTSSAHVMPVEPAPTPAVAVQQPTENITNRREASPDENASLDLVVALQTAYAADGDDARDQMLNQLFPALIAQDFVAAADFAASLPTGELRELFLRRLARAWAAVNFREAVGWIAGLPDGADRKAAFEDACFEAAGSRPAEAIQAWVSLGYVGVDHVLATLVQGWAGRDLTAAQVWVNAMPPGLHRDEAVARVAYVLADTSPAAAARYVVREIPLGPAQDEAVISVVHQWMQRDPARAAAWVEEFPPGPLVDRARAEIAGAAREADAR